MTERYRPTPDEVLTANKCIPLWNETVVVSKKWPVVLLDPGTSRERVEHFWEPAWPLGKHLGDHPDEVHTRDELAHLTAHPHRDISFLREPLDSERAHHATGTFRTIGRVGKASVTDPSPEARKRLITRDAQAVRAYGGALVLSRRYWGIVYDDMEAGLEIILPPSEFCALELTMERAGRLVVPETIQQRGSPSTDWEAYSSAQNVAGVVSRLNQNLLQQGVLKEHLVVSDRDGTKRGGPLNGYRVEE